MNMKKLLAFAMAASLSVAVFAEEADDDDDEDAEIVETELETLMPRKQVGIWPAYFAIAEIPATDQAPDVIGLRVTIPFSTKQESVTGFDIGLWGRTTYFEGFMLNLLRNDVKDDMSGAQVGLYNSIGGGQFIHSSASKSNGVIISDLTSGYYNTYFVGGIHV